MFYYQFSSDFCVCAWVRKEKERMLLSDCAYVEKDENRNYPLKPIFVQCSVQIFNIYEVVLEGNGAGIAVGKPPSIRIPDITGEN